MSRIADAVRVLTGRAGADSLGNMLDADGRGSRIAKSRAQVITQDSAFKNSVWWAGLTLWADVASTFPLDVTKPVKGSSFYGVVQSPGLMFTRPGVNMDITEFLYSSTMDKRRYGNCVGIITGRDAYGAVTGVELQQMGQCAAQMVGSKIKQWRVGNTYYDLSDIWHEKEFTLAGFDLGMSPLAHAAATMSIYQSAQAFAVDWFAQGANPRGILKNTVRATIPADVRQDAKDQFKAATEGGDLFVTGKEWEWIPQKQDAMSMAFLAQQAASDRDVCRYLGVPASMIDVEVSTGNITYANVTQANLQWLITKMGPYIKRTENYWTEHATPRPWTVKLNTSALLRMDDKSRAELMISQTNAMVRVPSEVRALDNLPAYTPEQMLELETFARLRKPPPAGVPTDPTDPQAPPTAAAQLSARKDELWKLPA